MLCMLTALLVGCHGTPAAGDLEDGCERRPPARAYSELKVPVISISVAESEQPLRVLADEDEDEDEDAGHWRTVTPASCLAAPPPTPSRLSAADQACLETLTAARERFAFAEPPASGDPPCALDALLENGAVWSSERVVALGPREWILEATTVAGDGDARVAVHRRLLDGKGRLRRQERVYRHYYDHPPKLGCVSMTVAEHVLNRKGWPRETRNFATDCEEVDEFDHTTTRRFSTRPGFVHARTETRDEDGNVEVGSEWWIEGPSNPVAWGEREEPDEFLTNPEAECNLAVRSCDGTELGHVRSRRNSITATRWVWDCEA